MTTEVLFTGGGGGTFVKKTVVHTLIPHSLTNILLWTFVYVYLSRLPNTCLKGKFFFTCV